MKYPRICFRQTTLTSTSAATSSLMLWATSCLGVGIGAGGTMGPGGVEMGGTTEPVPLDQGEDDHTEFIREPHTEMGAA
jgi:hypothetical protein